MIDIHFSEQDLEPPKGPYHAIPLWDWVDHELESWCPCKPDYDEDFDTYTHKAVDGRLDYEKKGWLLD